MVSGPQNRSEAQLKAAVIERLILSSLVDDEAVLITEMPVAKWTRRADLVLANGKLWGFEIKSDADSLGRLAGQLATFTAHFEKFVVVAASRFAESITEMIPEGVGLWLAEQDGTLRQRVAPRQSQLSAHAYISFMTVSELHRLLSSHGVKFSRKASRSSLVEKAASIEVAELASAARAAVKQRYRDRHAMFLNNRDQAGSFASLKYLRRQPFSLATNPVAPHFEQTEETEFYIPRDHPLRVDAPAGPVLKRLVR